MMIFVFLGFPQSGVTAYQVAKLNNKEAICTLLNNYYNTKSESDITEVSLCIQVCVCLCVSNMAWCVGLVFVAKTRMCFIIHK